MSEPSVAVNINGTPIPAFLDTGAFNTILALDVYQDIFNGKPPPLEKYGGKCLDANANPLPVMGIARGHVKTPTGTFETALLVYRRNPKVGYSLLVGMDILTRATINFTDKVITFSCEDEPTSESHRQLKLEFPSRTISGRSRHVLVAQPQRTKRDRLKLTKEDNNPTTKASPPNGEEDEEQLKEDDAEAKNQEEDDEEAKNQEEDDEEAKNQEEDDAEAKNQGEDDEETKNEKEEEYKDRGHRDRNFNKGRRHPRSPAVYLTRDIILPPQTLYAANVPINHSIFNDGEDLVIHQNMITPELVMPNTVTSVIDGSLNINLMNLRTKPTKLKAGTKLGEFEHFTQVTNNRINSVSEAVTKNHKFRKLTPEDVRCDDADASSELLNLLNQYREVCWLPGEPLGQYQHDKLKITLKTDEVINRPPYRIPHAYQDGLDQAISEMLKDKIIAPSKSSFNSPIIIVKKNDGGLRICLDLRSLNKALEPVHYPIPRIDDLLNRLGEANVLSTIDLAHAYHQCEIAEGDCEKTAFTVNNRKYHYLRVPFGIQSAPGFFARIINEVLYDVLGANCLAYLDDLILFTKTRQAHMEILEAVLKALAKAQMKLKVSKCNFFATEIKFLGYRVTNEGLTMDPSRISAINAMPLPKNKKQLQAFLGVANYYRFFVKNFATIAEPLYQLLRKNTTFKWTDKQTWAVNRLKGYLANAPIVIFPNFSKEFFLHTDSSDYGLGAVLMQEKNGLLHPLAYVSKTLNASQRRYSATKKEALALVFALTYFRHIILLYKITVLTDHKPLLGALEKPTKDEFLQRWALLVQDYNIRLEYIEGRRNIFADTLSRLPEPTSLDIETQFHDSLVAKNSFCNVLSDYIPIKSPWDAEKLRKAQTKDVTCREIIAQLTNNKTDNKIPDQLILNSRLIRGILYVVRTIERKPYPEAYIVPYVPDMLMKDALKLTHEEILAGHKDTERTLKLFRKNFYHIRERKLIDDHCQSCTTCIRAKGIAKPIPIKTYPLPSRPFHTICSDILGPLRITEGGMKYIVTFRDYTTRYTVLYAIPDKSTSRVIDCLRNLISHYGSSKVLLTDNGSEYISELLSDFCKFYNTDKVQVAPYHPSSAGFSERINREVNKMLRIFVNELAINDWDRLLPVVQLCINSTYNQSLKETPFYALFGYDSASSVLNPPRFSYREDELTQHMQRVIHIRKVCQKNLLEAQANYTKTANQGRKNKTIRIGQRVFAKIDKHRTEPKKKLDLPISGPFKVLRRSGKAWVLEELTTHKHYVVHADYIITKNANKGRKEEPIRVGQRVFAKIGNHHTENREELNLPISGPFKVLRRSGKDWVLEELTTHNEYVVPEEYIMGRHVTQEPNDPPTLESSDGEDTDGSLPESEEPTGSEEPPRVSTPPSQPTPNNNVLPDRPIRQQPPRACKDTPK